MCEMKDEDERVNKMLKKKNDKDKGGKMTRESNTNKEKPEKKLEYTLVLKMLQSLTLIVIILIGLAAFTDKEFIEYSKWVFTALLAAFGAWIGAGAAYFFGKENLKLSSDSTQKALETQQKALGVRPDKTLIKDINLTPIDEKFRFSTDKSVEDVIAKLSENVDYWFVPVLENEKMKDVIHTEAFWRFNADKKDKKIEEPKISDVLDYIKEKLEVKANKLHNFFLEVKMNDNVKDVSKLMRENTKTVGILCDENDKPTHCFTRKDLSHYL